MKSHPILTNTSPDFWKPKEKLNEHLVNLGEPHVESFNQMLDEGLKSCARHINPVQLQTALGDKVLLKIESISISKPSVPLNGQTVRDSRVYPVECRQRHYTYQGNCNVVVGWSLNNSERTSIGVDLGEVPIMIKSKACNLHGLSPAQMVTRGEHEQEWGGYFIVKGNEKIIRMLLMSRRNYPIAIKRNTWKDRGENFTELGIMVRSVRRDEVSYNNVLHYLNNGTAKLMFSQGKSMSYVPVCLFLRCLVDFSDSVIYKKLTQGFENNQYYLSSVQNMLREVHVNGQHSKEQSKDYLGELFRSRIPEMPPWATNSEICDFILDNRVLIHLDSHEDKFNFLVLMVQKLFHCAQDLSKVENVDGVMMQEVLLGGHLYQKYLCDRIDLWLMYVQKALAKKCSDMGTVVTPALLGLCFKQAGGIGRALESFLATGNAPSRSGLGLMQNSGLCVMAENINRMRYMSHFRAVHRGSFFTTMRTTEARQLLPDAWGFICPVHTPDGTPCGLLNHLSISCQISNIPDKEVVQKIPQILTDLGMIPFGSPLFDPMAKLYVVVLEGKVLGHIRMHDANRIVDRLRLYKIEEKIPKFTEIAFVPYKEKGQFPGLFLFVGPARMMRPVKNLALGKIEYIGSFEQVYMDIAVDPKEMYEGLTTHLELSKLNFMSNLANLIPLPDYNQSPRNMYQCQMGKQTMGTPCHNYPLQSPTKIYRIQTPGAPLFRPVHHDNIELDDFAMGTNAIVAVISYTGYDMEDAMVINKMAHDRGFAYGTIYKSHFIDLKSTSYFARDPNNPNLAQFLDTDGLPHPGTKITYKSVLYCYYDTEECIYKVIKNDEKEEAIVDSVKLCGDFKLTSTKTACIIFRVPRKATIGDKFASRAGQKGICSQLYPSEDLPFTETGLIPDIIFNPHGFPSRMTIAMMIEMMAGKSAAMHGLVHDATPFQFTEKHTAIDYFGKLLEAGGYNYYGTEKMYSGVDGREMTADIFFGVVHYQRLRHMVLDKWQVRSTGPVDAVTQQPIKGRKRGGGVRFGEMERDALISHGAVSLLQDRLFYNSDKANALVCNSCGSMLAPIQRNSQDGTAAFCKICGSEAAVSCVEVPFVYKYLVAELSSLNINAKFKLEAI